ncbi:MAG: DUF2726 domain-containing protein [Pseudomonadales bacterium]|nr:DUF2726 domain-containing protein [Pseudomonadales bacterium]
MDILFWAIAALLFLFLAVPLIRGRESQHAHLYSLKSKLLSPAERSFLGVLNLVVDNSTAVFAKVRVADVLKPRSGMNRSNWQSAFNRISNKHFDFVLCNKSDMSVIAVIELNDKSHNSRKRQARDRFLKQACESASLSILEVTAKMSYNVEALRQELCSMLNRVEDQENPS